MTEGSGVKKNKVKEEEMENDENTIVAALISLKEAMQTSTNSMTSVPKPLKYLRPHYVTIKAVYDNIENGQSKKLCAEVVSVLAMASSDVADPRDSLKYGLLGNISKVGEWGHEYIRQLEMEIVEEWNHPSGQIDLEDVFTLVNYIMDFDMSHNAEIQGCDLAMEIDKVEIIFNHVDNSNYSRVCHYLLSCAQYLVQSENKSITDEVFKIYERFNEYQRAMVLALQLNDFEKIKQIFLLCPDKNIRSQLCYMIGQQHLPINLNEDEFEEEISIYSNIINNENMNSQFHNLGRELDVLEPKTPEEVFKTWLEGPVHRHLFTSESIPLDSAKQNLASSFVNGFVNVGFSKDKLITSAGSEANWIFRNKDHGMISATASLGLIYLWDIDGGLTPIDKYFYVNNDFVKAGAVLATGILHCGIRSEQDTAKALIPEYLNQNNEVVRYGAILGLGLAYVGTHNTDVISILSEVLNRSAVTPEEVSLTCLACGLIAVGSEDKLEVAGVLLQKLMELDQELNGNTFYRFIALALGLCYLGKKDSIEVTQEALETLADPYKSMAQTMLQICAYAGSGDVEVIQSMLKICSEHYQEESKKKSDIKKQDGVSKDKKTEKHSSKKQIHSKSKDGEKKEGENENLSSMQPVATIGVAIISMGEETGNEMSLRIFGQMLRYGEPVIRRAVPIAIGLSFASNPQLPVIDVLSKLSHDSDIEVAQNAIFAMGLVGAGTNNARLARMLRMLALYHNKNPNHLFLIRISQGLIHLGKGTMTLSPFHMDRQVLSPFAISGLLVTAVSFLDVKNIILAKSHYLLYCLVTAMHPRWLITIDENLKPIPVSIRVGQGVDTVGKAGTPKTISGIRTHTTPVLLAAGERAELATEDYVPLTPFMEGYVILQKNSVKVN